MLETLLEQHGLANVQGQGTPYISVQFCLKCDSRCLLHQVHPSICMTVCMLTIIIGTQVRSWNTYAKTFVVIRLYSECQLFDIQGWLRLCQMRFGCSSSSCRQSSCLGERHVLLYTETEVLHSDFNTITAGTGVLMLYMVIINLVVCSKDCRNLPEADVKQPHTLDWDRKTVTENCVSVNMLC